MLLSKINAGMLLKCQKSIMPDIVKEMQRYKTRPESFDTNKRPDIAKLVDVGKDFSDYDEAGHSTDGKTM